MRHTLIVVLVCLLPACSDSPTSPSPPPAPTVVQVGGVWSYSATLNSVSGGECVGELQQSAVGGVERGSLQITQTGSALTATSTSDVSGATCNFTGTAGAGSLALNGSFCSLGSLTGIRCSNGSVRDMRIQTLGINATVSGSSANGTRAETWNVFTGGTTNGVGTLTMNGSFTATRR